MADTTRPWAHMVVHCRRQPYDVLCDRSTIFGNPFIIGKDGNREEVIAKHRAWVEASADLRAIEVRTNLHHLTGKILACWCSPQPCHCETLAELANKEAP